MTNFEIGPDTPQVALDRMETELNVSLETIQHSPEGVKRIQDKLAYIAFENLQRVQDKHKAGAYETKIQNW